MHRLVETERGLDTLDVLRLDGRVERVDGERPTRCQMHQAEPDDRHADDQRDRLQETSEDEFQHRVLRASSVVQMAGDLVLAADRRSHKYGIVGLVQRAIALGQRGWKRQPDGGLIGEGTSPLRMMRLRLRPTVDEGAADSSASV